MKRHLMLAWVGALLGALVGGAVLAIGYRQPPWTRLAPFPGVPQQITAVYASRVVVRGADGAQYLCAEYEPAACWQRFVGSMNENGTGKGCDLTRVPFPPWAVWWTDVASCRMSVVQYPEVRIIYVFRQDQSGELWAWQRYDPQPAWLDLNNTLFVWGLSVALGSWIGWRLSRRR